MNPVSVSTAPRANRARLKKMRGAALVEFVIAVVPLLMTFFGFSQYAKMYTAKLGVRHAAITAARAAAVISDVNGNNPAATGGENAIRQAAGAALSPWITNGSISNVTVTITDSSSAADPYGPVRVEVRATYRCAVPMMGRVMCPGSRKTLTAEATMPHQGAKYKVQ